MPNPDRVDQSHLLSEINGLLSASNAMASTNEATADKPSETTAQYKVFNLSKQIYDYGIFSGVVSEYSMKQKTPTAFCQLISMLGFIHHLLLLCLFTSRPLSGFCSLRFLIVRLCCGYCGLDLQLPL